MTTLTTYTVHLGCSCPSARGWSVDVPAASPAEAAEAAAERASTCCRCGPAD